jgi:hypothetical protein
MSSIVFLLVFVVFALVGGFMLWWRERGPRSMEAHMREFERHRQALSPGPPPPPPRRSPSRPPGRDDWVG